jgi:geranylgeranyl reductase family protein
MKSCDVLVVGGGPAGSSCAGALRAAGLDTLVLDKGVFPRDKACAGWVTPAVWETLGVAPADYATDHTLQPIRGFRTGVIGGASLETRYEAPVSYGIRRCEFDDYLLRRSAATVRHGTLVTSVRRARSEWIINDLFRTPLLIGAGGHFCPVAHALEEHTPKSSVVVAQELEFPMDARQQRDCKIATDVPELYFSKDLKGYGWCVRKENYLNIGLGRRDTTGLAKHLREFTAFLSDTKRTPSDLPSRWRGHAYLLYEKTRRRAVHDGALLIGDAAGLAAAASGEGIRPAVESGLLAAEAVLAADGSYQRDGLSSFLSGLVKRLGRPHRRVALPVALTTFLGSRLMHSPWFVRRVLLDQWFLGGQAG